MSILLIVIFAALVFWVWVSYNSLVRMSHRADEAWQDIEVQLKRRYDLVPNLIESVKGYAAHEQGTLEKVIEARNSAMRGGTTVETAAQQNMLVDALKNIFALAESYPDLKANQNFLQLQGELSDTENKIQAARRFYNANVRDLSITIDSFPGNIIASMFRFTKKEYFDLPDSDAAQQPVAVKF